MGPYKIYLIGDHRNKCYVGMTSKSPKKRLREHKNKARGGGNTHLYRGMRKYGANKFRVISLDAAPTREKAFELEKDWIERLGTYEDWGYNMTKGGDGTALEGKDNPMHGTISPMRGKSHSEETRKKMSCSNRGVKGVNTKLTRQEAAEVKYLAQRGERPQKKIAARYGIVQNTVSQIKNEYTWSHVKPRKP